MMSDLSDEPWYMQALASKFLPKIESAMEQAQAVAPEAAKAIYRPGIDSR